LSLLVFFGSISTKERRGALVFAERRGTAPDINFIKNSSDEREGKLRSMAGGCEEAAIFHELYISAVYLSKPLNVCLSLYDVVETTFTCYRCRPLLDPVSIPCLANE
jgi:hypothetical protein